MAGFHEWPAFPRPAPALLGFDETIYAYCSAKTHQSEGLWKGDSSHNRALARRCTLANENVLRVVGGWNMCVNLQWQFCAMRGLLHGQGSKQMHFSIAPKDLDVSIFRSPSKHNQTCEKGPCSTHYSVADVYFAEVCVISQLCRNRKELFMLEIGELFECDFDKAGLRELRSMLSGQA